MRNFDKTWIKLPRSFTSWRWYHESKMVHLFLYLLLQANVKKKDYLSLTIYPGQVVTSLVQIAQDTGLSIRNVRTCLKKLSSTKDIKVKSSNKGTIVSICNFECFLQLSNEDDTLGWIKLYRKILSWKWYQDGEKVHLFVHLLLNAIYKSRPDESLSRAQLAISNQDLHTETCIPLSSIWSILGDLEKTGEIEISLQSNLITICNYNQYQGVYDGVFDGDMQVARNRHAGDTQMTDTRQISDMQVTTPLYRYNDIKARTSSTHVCACEGRKFQNGKELAEKKPSKESYYFALLDESSWLEAVRSRYHFANLHEVLDLLRTFNLDMQCRGKEKHDDLSDYKSHFCDWLKKQDFKKPKSVYGSRYTPQASDGRTIYGQSF